MTHSGADHLRTRLANVPALQHLPQHLLSALVSETKFYEANPGDLLIEEGDKGDSLLILLDGKAGILFGRSTGEARRVVEVSDGVLFGEMSLMTSQPHRASVIAETDCQVAVLPIPLVDRLIREAPEFGVMLAELIASRIGNGTSDVLIGDTLNGYRIQSLAGRGGMAVVYRAIHLESGQTVALKMMSHRLIYDRIAVSRFEQEARIIGSLRHDHVVRLLDCFSDFLTRFLVMEFCSGWNLAHVIRSCGPLSESEARSVLGQIALGLGYAHQRQIVHRDLKPSNVVVEAGGRVKLTDFGLAVSATSPELTAQRTCLGTIAYMAPEQLAGQTVDEKADLYSFGCVAYELVTGRPLYQSSSSGNGYHTRLYDRLPQREEMPSDLSSEYFDMMCRCLAMTPQERVVDLAEVAAWARPLDGRLVAKGRPADGWLDDTIVQSLDAEPDS